MKKHIVIFFIIIISHYSSFAQQSICNDSILLTIKGKWKLTNISQYPNKPQAAAISGRLDTIHKLLLEAYSKPVANEGVYLKSTDYTDEWKIGVSQYNYVGLIYNYACTYQHKVTPPGSRGETSTFLTVAINNFKDFWTKTPVVIKGMNVFYRCRKIGQWKGIDLYDYEDPPDYHNRKILISRQGELPFKPVSRKEYLDHMLFFIDSFYNAAIKGMKEYPDSSQANESIRSLQKQKDNDINRYHKELEANRNNNRLDWPAITNGIQKFSVNDDEAIFFDDETNGYVLVTLNPSYFKKDLPGYIPQFMVLQWSWNQGVGGDYFRKMFTNNFPIEKLQTMIDKR